MTSSDTRRQRIYHTVGQLFTRVPVLARWWGKRYSRLVQSSDPNATPLAMLRKPLSQCRVALITTGGVHLRDQPPYDMADPRGDPTFRAIPADAPAEQLMITHDYYDHTDAGRDLNILLPLGLFRELAQQRHIGALATCYSFMGHIEPPHVETLLTQTAPQVAGMLRQERVDAVLLTPA